MIATMSAALLVLGNERLTHLSEEDSRYVSCERAGGVVEHEFAVDVLN